MSPGTEKEKKKAEYRGVEAVPESESGGEVHGGKKRPLKLRRGSVVSYRKQGAPGKRYTPRKNREKKGEQGSRFTSLQGKSKSRVGPGGPEKKASVKTKGKLQEKGRRGKQSC